MGDQDREVDGTNPTPALEGNGTNIIVVDEVRD